MTWIGRLRRLRMQGSAVQQRRQQNRVLIRQVRRQQQHGKARQLHLAHRLDRRSLAAYNCSHLHRCLLLKVSQLQQHPMKQWQGLPRRDQQQWRR